MYASPTRKVSSSFLKKEPRNSSYYSTISASTRAPIHKSFCYFLKKRRFLALDLDQLRDRHRHQAPSWVRLSVWRARRYRQRQHAGGCCCRKFLIWVNRPRFRIAGE
jgi:hypothetical protein